MVRFFSFPEMTYLEVCYSHIEVDLGGGEFAIISCWVSISTMPTM